MNRAIVLAREALPPMDKRIPLRPCARDGQPGVHYDLGGMHEIRCSRCKAKSWAATEIEARFRWNDGIKSLTQQDHTHPFAFLKHRTDLRKCCYDLTKNLDEPYWIAPDRVQVVCRVCGSRHTKMFMESGSMGVQRGHQG